MKEIIESNYRKKSWKEIGMLLFSGFVFMLFFSYATSPLYQWSYGWDSSFFQMVGAGMKSGLIPYRDFFDMKGPWLFFIEYFGQMLYEGRLGCFLIQLICFGVTLLTCRAIYIKYFAKTEIRGIKWGVFLPLFIIMASTMEGGNLTEELSLPFLLIPLYFSLDFIKSKKLTHKPEYSFVYGICFGILTLLRITNSVLILAIIFTVVIFLFVNRKWKSLAWNLMTLLAGMLAAFVLPLIYYGYYDAIGEMLYATFIFGLSYGTESFSYGTGYLFMILYIAQIVVLWKLKNKNSRIWMLIGSDILGTLITLGMGNPTLHDYLLLVPGVLLVYWELLEAIEEKRIILKKNPIFMIVLIVAMLYPCYKALTTGAYIIREANDKGNYQDTIEVISEISTEQNETVLGYEVPMRWYAISNITPSYYLCGWQEHYMKLRPEFEEEMDEMFRTAPPFWIVTKEGADIKNEMVLNELNNNYKIVKENKNYRLYKRKT